MIINESAGRMEIEERDINYILQSYIRMYQFQTKNKLPFAITFPMFGSVPISATARIPIEWVPEISPVAAAIKEDGSNVPLPTEASIAEADKKEKDYNAKKEQLAKLASELGMQVSDDGGIAISTVNPLPAVDLSPSSDRLAKAKQPDRPATGSSEYGTSRNVDRDARQVAQDLRPEKDVKEDEELPIDQITDIKQKE